MYKPINILRSVSFKLFLSLVIILLCSFFIYVYFNIQHYSSNSIELTKISSIRVSEIIRSSARYGMLLNRKEDVQQIVNTISQLKGMNDVKIYNKQGMIVFSANKNDVFKYGDLTSSACSPCHQDNVLKRDLNEQERIRIFKDKNDKEVLGLITPIYNEPECSNAACHAHPEQAKLLGILDVQLSLDRINTLVDNEIDRMIIYSIVLTLFISVFAGLFIWFLIRRPVKKLYIGTIELSKGNLNYKIDYHGKDEMGMLASSFNKMTDDLYVAYNEIKDWNEKLNNKVEEKTKELQEVYNQIVQIEKIASLGKLSATVAHELNNPLEGILTYSKLILKKIQGKSDYPDIQKITMYLELIASESARCGEIVKNLLIFSRTSERNIENNDIVEIVEKSLLLISHHLEIHKINLVKEIKADYLEIECDKNLIHQALVAILINAVEAIGEDGTINIKLIDDKESIKLYIIDSGCGMSKEQLNKMFEPFYTTKDGVKGLGLGLSIVYGIIKQHNGNIKVNSELNKGTEVILELPKKYKESME